MQKLKIDFPNWQDLSIDTAKFFHVEIEKRLQETITTFSSNKDKAFKILSILLPILTVSVGYFFTVQDKTINLLPAILFLVFQSLGALLILFIILPRNLQTLGAMPSKIINPKAVRNDSEKLQYIDIVLNYCENMESRILFNVRQNEICTRLLTLAILSSGIIAPISFLISFLLLR